MWIEIGAMDHFLFRLSTQILISSEKTLTDKPRINIYQLSKHSLVQSSWQIKLSILWTGEQSLLAAVSAVDPVVWAMIKDTNPTLASPQPPRSSLLFILVQIFVVAILLLTRVVQV